MDDFYYKAIQGLAGSSTEKDIKVALTKDRFAHDFDSSIGVVYDATRNDVQQDFIIVPTQEKGRFTIYARPDESVNIGDIIYWNRLHWLVTDIAFDDEIYTTGTIIRCNRQIAWQNEDGKIIKRWCFAAKPYTSNVNEGDVVTTLNGKYDIQISYDDETAAVSIGKRFMLDIIGGKPMCYKLDFADVNSNRYTDIDGGFIEWTLSSDEYNKDVDNIEKMLCDYITESNSVTNKYMEIVGKDELKAGYTNIYRAVVSDNLEGKQLVWSVDTDDVVRQHIHTSFDERSLSLSCDLEEGVVGHDIKLTLSDKDSLWGDTQKIIRVVSVYG